jgi:transcriptional regulator with XRE-family HTH domain
VVELNERIEAWRTWAGLNKTELARKIGVHMESVIQWENGATTPKSSNLEKIAAACGISMGRFWGRVPGKKGSVTAKVKRRAA